MPGRQGLILIAHDCEPTVQLLASMQAHDSYAVALTLPETLRRRAVEMLARLLREDGFLVAVAEGTREATRSLARRPGPEALIVDVSLPRSSHVEVVRYARKLNPNIPVMVISNCRLGAEHHQVDTEGPDPMLFTKPIDYANLRLELSRVLRSHTGQMLRVVE
ncbi:MAG TPA: response regulator, partial [Polyangiaceae bacterium]|nr:response regulator [Polyangiaceae bacterium]